MDNIFQYAFMQRAFVVAAIIAVIAPCIGVSIVLKRLSAIGDATSHSALAGIAFGLLLGINPILGAVMFSIFAVIGIEVFRKSFGKYSEIATVVVMSAGYRSYGGVVGIYNQRLNQYKQLFVRLDSCDKRF